jgi:hypothetical protein
MRFAADDVQEAVVRDSGHWLMEEQPTATVALIRSFLAQSIDACKRDLDTAKQSSNGDAAQ